MTASYIVYGMDASYFTQKILALFAYKEIPTDYRKKSIHVRAEVERRSGTHMMPVVVTPEDQWLWDSTPIAFEMDKRFPASTTLPDAPLGRIMARILEDFFDEWTVRAAVFFRWNDPSDIEHSGTALARDAVGIPAHQTLDPEGEKLVRSARDMIQNWAMGVCQKMDAGPDALAEIEGEWCRLATLLGQHFAQSDFLLGPRPCLADFALQGALTAHFLFDPTPRTLAESLAPDLIAYQKRMAAARASDLADGWPDFTSVPETLAPLLQQIGLSFHAYLIGNHRALAAGETTVDMDLGYGPRSIIARPYSEKTRRETTKDLAALDAPARALVEQNLAPLGVLEAYQLP
ncbi:glutathione S-transferase [Iodidimonas nitroreducens]|uniref:Glutathione S-transferase n=1 Tax=Iodidimonas nitroreducens TaxID=1236968 RepID=A0A5A7N4V9_9PROT|nr:glutathione S-transferase family protein [Iodidimonas nitroreducens]GAK34538.1 hypothetical protein AQ1_02437 [alpha proteobacterium Q-1]GER02794.1 glutathione S-transferase [Iodidimonas nitroreducens]